MSFLFVDLLEIMYGGVVGGSMATGGLFWVGNTNECNLSSTITLAKMR